MEGLHAVHDDHGATYTEVGGRSLVADYGRPERAHRAVRNVVGVTEQPVGVVTVEGEDRHAFVDDAVSNAVPEGAGRGVYALLLDPQGRIETDMYVFTAEDRLLVLTPPGEAEPLAAAWSEKTFIQDVDVTAATPQFAIFGVYGPKATEKVASVMPIQTPDQPLSYVRSSMGDAGVTVVRDDGIAGDEGYLVVAAAENAVDVFDTLENRGMNAAPFGRRVWLTLTLEAGTPLFESELSDRIPNQLGLRNAIDFEKGCFVGQEVVSRIENRGRPSKRLVGIAPEAEPDAGAAVFDGDASVGEVTRAAESPVLERPVALALIDADAGDDLSVRVDGTDVAAHRLELPFVEGSARSARLPAY
jgi:aminomethyltransferase